MSTVDAHLSWEMLTFDISILFCVGARYELVTVLVYSYCSALHSTALHFTVF